MIKSFQIGGKKYTVKYISKDEHMNYLGLAQSPLNLIKINTDWQGDTVPEESQEQTLFHEVTHCILNDMGRLDLSDDETFVQTLSLLFHQFVRTVK